MIGNYSDLIKPQSCQISALCRYLHPSYMCGYIMCGSNRSSTTPLSGKGGDIPLVWRPTLGANTVSGVPTLGLTQNQWSRPWGYHSTLTRKKVMSPPFPDRGVGHERFEPHIICKCSDSNGTAKICCYDIQLSFSARGKNKY